MSRYITMVTGRDPVTRNEFTEANQGAEQKFTGIWRPLQKEHLPKHGADDLMGSFLLSR